MASPPILTLSDIHLTFGGNPLFKGLDLNLQEGERICLVGRNGSGKSTLLKIISGMVEPDTGDRFVKPGITVGYMDQEPDLSGYETLGDFATEGLSPNETYKVDVVADGLKLALDRKPSEASGGECRRAALAKIVAAEPELMLLDEPTNHLDIVAIRWLEDHLRATSQAFVIISHDRAFLKNLTRSTIWVDRGMARQHPKGFEAFEEWRDRTFEEEDMQRHKLNRLIKAEGRWAVEGISARRKRNQGRVRRLQGLRQERTDQIARNGPAKMAFSTSPKSGKLVVEATDIAKAYAGKVIVSDFSMRIQRGERIALVGPNGVGKTTLLNILTGALQPDAGKVKMGTNLVPVLFDQNRAQLNPKATLWETLTGDKELGLSGTNDQIMVRGLAKHVVGYLKEFLFDEGQARGPVSALSGGEKARLWLSVLMARDSNLLIMDEPTNDLDVETLDLLQELLDDYQGTVILVSHDRDFLDRIATTTIAMEGDGRATIFAGGWSDYRAQRKADEKTAKQAKKNKPKQAVAAPTVAQTGGLNFAQKHRLGALPAEIERLTAEITKLEEFMADPNLFTDHPAKFQKASDALVERHETLSDAEEEWLKLEELNVDG